MTIKELSARLGTTPLFERCSKRELKAIARHIEVKTIEPSTVLVREAENDDGFFIVLSGEVEISKAGQPDAVTLSDGSHFGELALLDPAPRSATVTALTEVEVGVLGTRMFRVLLREMPQMSERLLASLASQLREARSTA